LVFLSSHFQSLSSTNNSVSNISVSLHFHCHHPSLVTTIGSGFATILASLVPSCSVTEGVWRPLDAGREAHPERASPNPYLALYILSSGHFQVKTSTINISEVFLSSSSNI
jgi:hypothetical protein